MFFERTNFDAKNEGKHLSQRARAKGEKDRHVFRVSSCGRNATKRLPVVAART